MITIAQAKAKAKIKEYLKQHFIEYKENNYNGTVMMVFRGFNNCPNKILEGCIYFCEKFIEWREIGRAHV